MTSTLTSSYSSAAAFVGGDQLRGGQGETREAAETALKIESSYPQQSPGSYLRQYTFDVFPGGSCGGEHPSARSRSLYSETTTTRPYSSAGAHSSTTSATSDEDEDVVTPATPRRPAARTSRKLSLTFLTGTRAPPVSARRVSPQREKDKPEAATARLHPAIVSSAPNLVLHSFSPSHSPPPATSTAASTAAARALQFTAPPLEDDGQGAATPPAHIMSVDQAPSPSPSVNKEPSSITSQNQAAIVIARAWRAWRLQRQSEFAALVEAIQEARRAAAITIQRVWKGHQLRRFVHDEVCKLRILYWDPSMKDMPDRELENWTVKIFGSFTVPAWKSEVPMEYCRLRRMFVLHTNLPLGRYECKFIVNGKHTTCPWLHETTSDPLGVENSFITIAAHPLREWWGKRLMYLDQACRSKCTRSKGFATRGLSSVPSRNESL